MDSVDFKTLERPRSPNTYLLAPEGLCESTKPDRLSEVYPIAAEHLFQGILSLVDARSDWHIKESDAARGLIHFVSVSRLMRYKDDVDIMVLSAEAGDAGGQQGARLAVYSRSRIGHSDLGANKKRVNQLLESLRDVQVPT